ncbi:MAG TPA: Holliday junction branch migration protein RuvA [Clostridiaceae bacterium]|nr:Holliday junction branch migration protein RuvA [Clostridiaceae bacterium]
MFSYIKGKLEVKTTGYVVIDINGLGYKIFMSDTAINKIGDIGEVVKVHTYVKVREDDISIYGFNTNEELRMFELLLSVSGIGAKSAITILSNVSPSSFALAVITNNVGEIKKLPGIGPKTAQRIILELKDKLKTEESIESDNTIELKNAITEDNKVQEAISALQVLGYSQREIETAMKNVDKDNLSVEDIIRKGLYYLSK